MNHMILILFAMIIMTSCSAIPALRESLVPAELAAHLPDAERLKLEYEGLNGTIRSDGVLLGPVEISTENTFKYLNTKEALDFSKRGTGVVFFGAGWCRWCRYIVPEYITIAGELTEYPAIYYVPLEMDGGGSNDMSSYKVLSELIGKYLEKAGTSFANVSGNPMTIDDYIKGNKEGEYQIYPAITLFFNNGTLTGMNVGTVPGHDNSNRPLGDDEKEALKASFLRNFAALGTNPCPTKC